MDISLISEFQMQTKEKDSIAIADWRPSQEQKTLPEKQVEGQTTRFGCFAKRKSGATNEHSHRAGKAVRLRIRE